MDMVQDTQHSVDKRPAEWAQRERINRLLAKDRRRLSKLRQTSGWFAEYGPNVIVDIDTMAVIAGGIDDLDALEAALESAAAALQILKVAQ
jgi:hypothetical protein